MISRLRPYYSLKELFAFLHVKKGSIQTFEKKFAGKFKNKNATMFAHGRTGLYALFKVWGLNNDEIICPAYTCVVVPHAISLSGNIPVFVDSKSDGFNMDLEELEKTISKKTRAIIVTHLFGYPMNIDAIERIVAEKEKEFGNKIYIIQDVAHSFGTEWNNRLVTESGDAAIFGMNISKIMNSVFGGMVTTNNDDLDGKLKSWRDQNLRKDRLKFFKRWLYLIAVFFAFKPIIYGFINWLERLNILDKFVKYYEDDKIYFPSDWDVWPINYEATIGLIQLEKYDDIIAKRRAMAKEYHEALSLNEDIELIPFDSKATYSHMVGIVKNRDEWVKKFARKGIQLGILIEYSIPEMKAYQKLKQKEYPNAEYFKDHLINFPIWAGSNRYFKKIVG